MSHILDPQGDLFPSQTAAAYVLFYRRRTEGRPTHILDRSLSQSFAEEVRVQKAKFRPNSESAHEEEGEEEMQCGEEGGQERKRSRNEVGSPEALTALLLITISCLQCFE